VVLGIFAGVGIFAMMTRGHGPSTLPRADGSIAKGPGVKSPPGNQQQQPVTPSDAAGATGTLPAGSGQPMPAQPPQAAAPVESPTPAPTPAVPAPLAPYTPSPEPPRAAPSEPPTVPKLDTSAPATRTAKQSVPTAEALDSALARIDETYQLSEVSTDERRLEVARDMLALGRQSQDERVVQYGLLQRAMELALAGGDSTLMLDALAVLEREYEVDGFALRQSRLTEFARQAVAEKAIESLVQSSNALLDESLAKEHFEAALELVTAVYAATQRPTGRRFRKEVFDRRKEIVRLHEAWSAVQQAREKLTANPNDPEANLAYGRYLCLDKGDFKAGLALLAKCGAAELKAATERDLAAQAGDDTALQVAAADAWYDLAFAAEADEPLLARAQHWYQLAKPKLSGLDQRKAVTRVEEIAKVESAQRVVKLAAAQAGPRNIEVAVVPPESPRPESPRPESPRPEPSRPVVAPADVPRPAVAPRVGGRPDTATPVVAAPVPVGGGGIPPRKPVVFDDGVPRRPVGTLRTTLEGHTASIRTISFSRDGSRVASAGDDGTIRIW
jgi:hypothetical protein